MANISFDDESESRWQKPSRHPSRDELGGITAKLIDTGVADSQAQAQFILKIIAVVSAIVTVGLILNMVIDFSFGSPRSSSATPGAPVNSEPTNLPPAPPQ